MVQPSVAQAQATPITQADQIELPGQSLTLQETLWVMDVAREMRDRRETAEEMFRRDDLRRGLREKIMQTAQLAGDKVTEAEVDAAIKQYFDTLHTYEDPPAGMKSLLAHLWVWRYRAMMVAAAATAVIGSVWILFG